MPTLTLQATLYALSACMGGFTRQCSTSATLQARAMQHRGANGLASKTVAYSGRCSGHCLHRLIPTATSRCDPKPSRKGCAPARSPGWTLSRASRRDSATTKEPGTRPRRMTRRRSRIGLRSPANRTAKASACDFTLNARRAIEPLTRTPRLRPCADRARRASRPSAPPDRAAAPGRRRKTFAATPLPLKS
jgi:hypothetical protein